MSELDPMGSNVDLNDTKSRPDVSQSLYEYDDEVLYYSHVKYTQIHVHTYM